MNKCNSIPHACSLCPFSFFFTLLLYLGVFLSSVPLPFFCKLTFCAFAVHSICSLPSFPLVPPTTPFCLCTVHYPFVLSGVRLHRLLLYITLFSLPVFEPTQCQPQLHAEQEESSSSTARRALDSLSPVKALRPHLSTRVSYLFFLLSFALDTHTHTSGVRS